MSATTLGYVPYLRPGALLFTLIVFRYFQTGRRSKERILFDVYGTIGGRKRNLFGESVATIANQIFGGSVQPKDVLLRHTLFGVYSRALSPTVSTTWSSALIAGDRSLSAQKILGVHSALSLRLVTQDLRSCTQCVAEDIDAYGFGQWRILHQIPTLLCCPEHGCPLNEEVKGAKAGNIWPYAFPHGRISTPADRISWTASDGHSTYLELWTELFDGKLPVLTSHAWAAYMDLVVAKIGGLTSAQTEIEAAIRRSWSTDTTSIRSTLGNHIEDDFVRAELSHYSRSIRLAQKLIILGAISTLGIAPPDASEFSQLRIDLCSKLNGDCEPSLQERLRRFLLDATIPGALAPFLLSDRNICQIARDAGVHRRHVWKTMERIPDLLLDEIASAQESSGKSWVMTELQRRRARRPA